MKPRDICEVIDRIAKRVPRVAEDRVIKSIKRRAGFIAPEIYHELWQTLCDSLVDMNPTAEEDAHIRAVLERNEA